MSSPAMTNPTVSRPALSIPIVTPISRAIAQDVSVIYYLLTIALTVLVLAIKVWGLPALVLTALAAVPVMFAVLIAIARP